jgi:MOSC domain-containing protein YiiM
MRLISINVAQPVDVPSTARGTVRSGIYKLPVAGRVRVGTLNVEGDDQGDHVNHGGPDQAVYVYAAEDYLFWAKELGREFTKYGWFGENLTIEGASSDSVCVGDVWDVGGARLQVTWPRSPCYKLDHKMGIKDFSGRFARTGRVGFYLRVLAEGNVEAGDDVTRVERALECVTVRQLSDMRHYGEGTASDAHRALALGLPASWTAPARQLLERAAP